MDVFSRIRQQKHYALIFILRRASPVAGLPLTARVSGRWVGRDWAREPEKPEAGKRLKKRTESLASSARCVRRGLEGFITIYSTTNASDRIIVFLNQTST
jgi:hypothetical protein